MADALIQELRALLPRCMLPDWVRLGARAARLLRERPGRGELDTALRRLIEAARDSAASRERRALHRPRPTYPPGLPICARREEIVGAIRAHPVVIVAGETGSGKTTQIPKMCLEAGLGERAMIGCTQPRRVAALSISRRIAEELGVAWGREVGCKIRFEDRTGDATYVKLMTDGILLAEAQGDPDLADYEAIIIDEAHERSLNIDFLLGHLKNLLARRDDLKVLITSATIDTAAFSRAFGDAPIIEVSGRTFPVEVEYRPPPGGAEEADFVEAAARECESIFLGTSVGDVLVFLPGERDIRECADLVSGRLGSAADVVPLFGRLGAGDQQRVFAASDRRKVVIATNIAETSLTIPGIRFVVDAGLARISRYNPRTRTRRLPVEPVSRSSADQRKGRAGRVEAGVCIRLYPEEDFLARPPFTQPEIQRANLAEVILRMKASRLGDIETFPFVNPPSPAAISGGYALLRELGALDEAHALTPLGRDLARLPIDPTLGRMLLQSRAEHATRELLVIAAGLSIQDPRERPLDRRDAADAAHRRFADARSDFLSLLAIWNAVHDRWESLPTQAARRRFCREHFLSYLRMREWQDLHAQLEGALERIDDLRLNESNADYDAIHRSILAGLLGHVGVREERNVYVGSGNRRLAVFPGSALHERVERATKGSRDRRDDRGRPAPAKTGQPRWIVAGEIVETSQLFARTLAGIDPHWIVRLAPHLCRVAHRNPHWSAEAGRVLVEEITTFHGLEVFHRRIAYGNIAPAEAAAIFIRSALVEDALMPSARGDGSPGDDDAAGDFDADRTAGVTDAEPAFLRHNRALREKVENWQTRLRRTAIDLDETFRDFYARHITGISSLHELRRLLRENPSAGFLHATEAEITGGRDLGFDSRAFPDTIEVAGQPVPLAYAYAPGEEHDGVTIRLPSILADSAPAALLEWAVPGLREARVEELLRALPKSIRRDLMPFPPKVAEIAREFEPHGPSFLAALASHLARRYGVAVTPDAWGPDALPAHLRPRIELLGHDRRVLAAGRDLGEVRERAPKEARRPAGDPPAWTEAARRWERAAVTGWNFGDLPARITVVDDPRFPLLAWPGLESEAEAVNVRLFRTEDAARRATPDGFRRLVERALSKDLAWLEKDLRALSKLDALYAPLGGPAELRESAFVHLRRHILPATPPAALTAAAFEAAVAESRSRMPGLVQGFIDRLGLVLRELQAVRERVGPPPAARTPAPTKPRILNGLGQLDALLVGTAQAGAAATPAAPSTLAAELAALLPPGFLGTVDFERLRHLPRHLKALRLRAERAANNPAKDAERVRQLAPYLAALQRLRATPPALPDAAARIEEFRWLVEEFKVSLFAQELGTAVPVSAKRLDQALESLR